MLETEAVAWFNKTNTAETGTLSPGRNANAMFLLDMSGNVWEWLFEPGSGNPTVVGGAYEIKWKSKRNTGHFAIGSIL